MNALPVHAVVLAAGHSTRMQGVDKLFLPLSGSTVLRQSVLAFLTHPQVSDVTAVVSEKSREKAEAALSGLPVRFVTGGDTRLQSVKNAVATLTDGVVALHDAARPFVTEKVITAALAGVESGIGTAPAVPVKDTVKITDDEGFVVSTPLRSALRAVQTPQCFLLAEYRAALMTAPDFVTDDAGVFEHAGYRVRLTEGDERNKKITTPFDAKEEKTMRIGHGYDVHRLTDNRKLILCGVEIPFEKGLLGHSDADVATHAVMDALLGAAGEPDIGHLFPDNDPSFEGADSLRLLRAVMSRLEKKQWRVSNLDVTVLCQRPKLAPYLDKMKQNLAEITGTDAVNVKATTEEGLGFTGSGDGIAAHCVCLLENV